MLVRGADFVFAGPGSPTYALRAWRDSGLREVLAAKTRLRWLRDVRQRRSRVSWVAAVPVYEIYKVGSDPHWVDGLDLLAMIGLRVAVIPHYDNAEGGTHDTRFCYLGEQRLLRMESMLDTKTWVLGVDEQVAPQYRCK